MPKKRSAKPPRRDDDFFDAYDFLGAAEYVGDVDLSFTALAGQLSAAKFKSAVDAIEKTIIEMLKDDLHEQGLEAVRENIKDLCEDPDPQDLEEALIFSQTIFNIVRVKGDKVDPLVNVFVREITRLTDEEYNSIEGQTQASIAMAEATAAQMGAAARGKSAHITPNPFRPQPQPPRQKWSPRPGNFKL